MTAPEPTAITREELAALAGADEDRIGQLIAAGLLEPQEDGRFAPADDGDVFGRTVNRASRIADVADPGALLTPASVAGSLPEGRYAVEPMGSATLSGIPGPVELVRVTALAGA